VNLSFASAADIRGLARLKVDGLALFLWSEQRPPTGTAGLVDWRLGGLLSQHLLSGWLRGALGETTLVPLPDGLGASILILSGLGEPETFDEKRFVQAMESTVRTIEILRLDRVALELPDRNRHGLGSAKVMDLFLRIIKDRKRGPREAILIEEGGAEREMRDVIERWERLEAISAGR